MEERCKWGWSALWAHVTEMQIGVAALRAATGRASKGGGFALLMGSEG
jgi:hypothetical protein